MYIRLIVRGNWPCKNVLQFSIPCNTRSSHSVVLSCWFIISSPIYIDVYAYCFFQIEAYITFPRVYSGSAKYRQKGQFLCLCVFFFLFVSVTLCVSRGYTHKDSLFMWFSLNFTKYTVFFIAEIENQNFNKVNIYGKCMLSLLDI